MNLRNIHAFGICQDLEVKRKVNSERITIKIEGTKVLQKIGIRKPNWAIIYIKCLFLANNKI